MRSIDFALTIGEREAAGYRVSNLASGLDGASVLLPPPPVALTAMLRRVALENDPGPETLHKAGALLFDWAFPSPIRAQLRLAQERADTRVLPV